MELLSIDELVEFISKFTGGSIDKLLHKWANGSLSQDEINREIDNCNDLSVRFYLEILRNYSPKTLSVELSMLHEHDIDLNELCNMMCDLHFRLLDLYDEGRL